VEGDKLTLHFEGRPEKFSFVNYGARTEEEAYTYGLRNAVSLAEYFSGNGVGAVITRADVKALESRKGSLMEEHKRIDKELEGKRGQSEVGEGSDK
jgi:hypothetical protein